MTEAKRCIFILVTRLCNNKVITSTTTYKVIIGYKHEKKAFLRYLYWQKGSHGILPILWYCIKMLSPKTCPHYLQHQMQLGNAAGLPTDPDCKTTKKIESSLLAKCIEFQLMFTKIKAHIEQAGTAFIDYYSLCLQGSTELRKRLLLVILLALCALSELLLSSSKSLTFCDHVAVRQTDDRHIIFITLFFQTSRSVFLAFGKACLERLLPGSTANFFQIKKTERFFFSSKQPCYSFDITSPS